MYSVHCTVDNIQFTWRIVETWLHVQCKLYSVECMYGVHQHTVQCAVDIVQCTWWKEGNLLYSVNNEEYCLGFIHNARDGFYVQCTLYTVNCTLYSVQCTLQMMITRNWTLCIVYIVNNMLYACVQCSLYIYIVQCRLWIKPIIHHSHCTVYIIHCILSLYTLLLSLYTVQCILYTVHCKLYIVHCTLYTLHCTQYIVRNTLYTVHRTWYTVQCTLYIRQGYM